MDTTKRINLSHVRKALKIIKDNGTAEIGFDQSTFCGTACCLWGHAALIAGRYTAEEFLKESEAQERSGSISSDGNIFSELSGQCAKWYHSKNPTKKRLYGLMTNTKATVEQFEAATQKKGVKS